jgi:hypothetical protein
VDSKWVFELKRDPDGNIARYKARLMARGFTQEHGVDYHETFAPIVRVISIRVVLALAAFHDWEVDRLDVVTTFLEANIDEEIYTCDNLKASGVLTTRDRACVFAAKGPLRPKASSEKLEQDYH